MLHVYGNKDDVDKRYIDIIYMLWCEHVPDLAAVSRGKS